MASDVQEPFNLSLQVDALHSSSISFGRFDLGSLSWERRSSFSHNRYLEDVEKYARPGCVTEKKAYFEEHFRRRALLRQASSASQAEREGSNSDCGSQSTSTGDEYNRHWIHVEKPQHMVENSNVCQFDESPESSFRDKNIGGFEFGEHFTSNLDLELHIDSTANISCINVFSDNARSIKSSSSVDVSGEVNHADTSAENSEPSTGSVCLMEDGMCNNSEQDCELNCMLEHSSVATHENDVSSKATPIDQTLDVPTEKCTSSSAEGSSSAVGINNPPQAVKKNRSLQKGTRSHGDMSPNSNPVQNRGTAQNNGSRERQTPLRSRVQRQMSESIGSSLHSSLRITKKENLQSLKTKPLPENRSENFRAKRAIALQPSTSERTESRRNPIAPRSMKQIATPSKEHNRSIINSSIRRAGTVENMRQEKKTGADVGQLSRKQDVGGRKKLSIISNTVLEGKSKEKLEVTPSNGSTSKALYRTLRSENQATLRLRPSIISGDKPSITPSKSTGSRNFLDIRRNINAENTLDTVRPASSSANGGRLMKVRQTKELVSRKVNTTENKSSVGLKDDKQMTKKKTMEVRPQGVLGRTGNASLRKSMGHSSVCR